MNKKTDIYFSPTNMLDCFTKILIDFVDLDMKTSKFGCSNLNVQMLQTICSVRILNVHSLKINRLSHSQNQSFLQSNTEVVTTELWDCQNWISKVFMALGLSELNFKDFHGQIYKLNIFFVKHTNLLHVYVMLADICSYVSVFVWCNKLHKQSLFV